MPEWSVVVRIIRCGRSNGSVAVCHVHIAVRAILHALVGGAVRVAGIFVRGDGVEKLGALGVRGYDCDFVAVVEGEVGVDEDEQVGDGGGEGERGREEGPGVRVRVEDYGQQRGRGL